MADNSETIVAKRDALSDAFNKIADMIDAGRGEYTMREIRTYVEDACELMEEIIGYEDEE